MYVVAPIDNTTHQSKSHAPCLNICFMYRFDQIQVGDAAEMLVTSFRKDFSTFKVKPCRQQALHLHAILLHASHHNQQPSGTFAN